MDFNQELTSHSFLSSIGWQLHSSVIVKRVLVLSFGGRTQDKVSRTKLHQSSSGKRQPKVVAYMLIFRILVMGNVDLE
uniref:Uncharacterized protein n=1 Tax=Anguilla anguilla TaxID=7936 RepID=A0A0E9PSR6_ANGAN